MSVLLPLSFAMAQDEPSFSADSTSGESSVELASTVPLPALWPEVPGGRRTELAPAAAFFDGKVHAFMVDGDERILFQTYELDSGDWSMDGYWQEVPGAGVTGTALAATSTQGRLYVFAVGKEGNVYVNDKLPGGGPLEGWNGWWRPLQRGKTAHAVATTADRNGRVYVFRTSTTNKAKNLFYTTDPLDSRTWTQVPMEFLDSKGKRVVVTTKGAPTAVYDDVTDSVHVFVVGSKPSGVFMATLPNASQDSSPNKWTTACEVKGAGTETPLAAAVLQGQLYLFSTRDKSIRAQVYGGACGIWSGKTKLLGEATTKAAPAVAPGRSTRGDDTPLLLFVRGTDMKKAKQKIYYHLFAAGDVVPEVTTRGHFSTKTGKALPGHTTFDYSVAGRIPGITAGTACPQQLAIAVHGWTNPPDDGQDKFQRAQASLRHFGYQGPVVGFSWDSDTQGCPLDFPLVPPEVCAFDKGKATAEGNAPKLASFLSDFKARCPCTAIHLMAHSLGARVALKTIKTLEEEPSLHWSGKLGEARIDDVHLLGAAVDDERPQMDDEFGESIENEVGKIYNYSNKNDEVLKRYYEWEEENQALGLKGIADSNEAPSNYVEVKFPDIGKDHYAYWGYRGMDGAITNPGAMEAVLARFEARSTQCLGYLDRTGCASIDGWAWDRAHSREAVSVGLYVDGGLLAGVAANVFRADLRDAGIGDGRHAFSYPVPLWLKDGQPHSISARFGETPFELNLSPGSIQCSLEGFLDGAGCVTDFLGQRLVVRGWAWDPSLPNEPISVEIYDNGRRLAVVSADQFRPDLLAAGKGDGRHGFAFSAPLGDLSGLGGGISRHEIQVVFAGTPMGLALSPRAVVCRGSQPPFP